MKAMVLAAGLGLRMRPLTLLRAKPALPVMNRPLIHWTLDQLRVLDVREVIVNLHHLPRTVTRAAGDGKEFGLHVQYSRERRILGTGGGPRKVRALLGDEPLLLVNGDVLFDFDLRRLVAAHRAAKADVTLGLVPNPDPRRYSRVVMGADGRILSLADRPRPMRGRAWLFTGVQVLEPRLLDRLPRGASDTVRDLYVPLIAEGARVTGIPLQGAWYDFGSPPLYLASQLALLRSGFGGARDGRLVDAAARIHPRARVARAVVGAGSRLEEGARVEASVIWGAAHVGRGCIVRRSVVASGARLRDGQSVEDVIVLPAQQGRSRTAPLVEGKK